MFSALARHKELISSKVKVTAMEGGALPAPAAGTCHLLAFPAGLLYTSLPLPKLGQAAVHAVADDARALPSLDRAVRMCQVRESPVEGEAWGRLPLWRGEPSWRMGGIRSATVGANLRRRLWMPQTMACTHFLHRSSGPPPSHLG